MTEITGELAFDAIQNAQPGADNFIQLPLIMVVNDVILPHTITPLMMDYDNARNDAAIRHALETPQTLIHVHNPGLTDNAQPSSLPDEHLGTEVALIDISDNTTTGSLLMVQGRRRVQVVAIVQEVPFMIARARVIDDIIDEHEHLAEHREDALHLFDELTERSERIPDDVADYVFALEDDSELVDTLASAMPLTTDERQDLLAEQSVGKRFKTVTAYLTRELQALDVREDVNNQVQDEMARAQREMYLREQMRVIQEELGEDDIFDQDLDGLGERILAARLPEEVHNQVMKEFSRLRIMPLMVPEASVIRTYLDWILDLPWHTSSNDNLNLRHAEKVLDSDHYGLHKVKERVLEHIAVRKLAGNEMRTPILCFVGPPGVGKTSLGQSIARALGRQFVRVSLGGVRDEAEIRGHRRTYIGALPGRILHTMKRAGTINPVFMLDEIDKMSEDYRGDPAAALLEVLDPEQNSEFSDHYLEVPYDLSQVLFIATANDLFPLPEALEDRMEVIEFHAYTEEEKLEIARRFLVPKQLKAHGLSRRGIRFADSALLHIIRHYTLEAGVRNLEREIANVLRKITRLAAMRKKYPKRITASRVTKYLGPPHQTELHLTREAKVGLATGLVWTAGGGDIQIIEATLLPGKGSLTLTGQLGEVLQESAQIALNYMRSRADDWSVPHDDFENYDVHIHMPEGAVPKEGPSAGITLATAIISVFTEREVRSQWAMTGEMTLRGHVLSVGGIKEKVLAARRRGIRQIILPADNEKDLVDIPKKALHDMQITFVHHIQEVIDVMLLDAPEQRKRDAHDINSGNAGEDADN